jgi:hypothetical protein
MAVNVKITICRNVTPCSSVERKQHSTETLVPLCQTARRHVLEDRNLQIVTSFIHAFDNSVMIGRTDLVRSKNGVLKGCVLRCVQ